MDDVVEVSIPVEAATAAILADPRNREAAGRLLSRMIGPRSGQAGIAQAIGELKAEARAAGLTDADIDAELAAHKAERQRGA